MSEWRDVKLVDITTKIGSGATPRGGKSSYVDTGTALIRSMNVHDFNFVTKDLAHIDERQAEKLSNVTVEAEDVLVNITGASVARTCLVPAKVLPARVNQHVAIIRPDPEQADAGFINAYLGSYSGKARLLNLASNGATREALTKVNLENFRLPLPPLADQRLISSILGSIDDLVENNRRRIEVLEEMAQAIYREWFVHFRYPGHEDATFVDSPLGPIPKGWEVTTIGSVLELSYGKALKKADRVGGNTSVIGSSGVVGFHKEPLLQGPSIIVGRKGNVGNVIWVPGPSWPIDTTFYVKTRLPLRYVAEQLKRAAFINSHAAVPGLSRDQAYSVDFLLPDESAMRDFQEMADLLGEAGQVLAETVEQLASIRDLLLPKLVTGEIDVSELDLDALVEAVS